MNPRKPEPASDEAPDADAGLSAASEVPNSAAQGGPSRRDLFGVAGIAAGALAVGGGAGFAVGRATASNAEERAYAFHGRHQSGIVTPQQDRLHFAAFDVTTSDRDGLIRLLQRWSVAAATLMAGDELGLGTGGGADVGVQVASRRVAQRGSSRTVFREGKG